MFSDEEQQYSLQVTSEGRGARCCGPPSPPVQGHGTRGEEASGYCSASPEPGHYKSPKHVDDDYSYAYRSVMASYAITGY